MEIKPFAIERRCGLGAREPVGAGMMKGERKVGADDLCVSGSSDSETSCIRCKQASGTSSYLFRVVSTLVDEVSTHRRVISCDDPNTTS